jgi:hypothetical protein
MTRCASRLHEYLILRFQEGERAGSRSRRRGRRGDAGLLFISWFVCSCCRCYISFHSFGSCHHHSSPRRCNSCCPLSHALQRKLIIAESGGGGRGTPGDLVQLNFSGERLDGACGCGEGGREGGGLLRLLILFFLHFLFKVLLLTFSHHSFHFSFNSTTLGPHTYK